MSAYPEIDMIYFSGPFPIAGSSDDISSTISNAAHAGASFIKPGLEFLSPSLPGVTEPALMALVGVVLIAAAVLLRRRALGSSVS